MIISNSVWTMGIFLYPNITCRSKGHHMCALPTHPPFPLNLILTVKIVKLWEYLPQETFHNWIHQSIMFISMKIYKNKIIARCTHNSDFCCSLTPFLSPEEGLDYLCLFMPSLNYLQWNNNQVLVCENEMNHTC